MIKMNWKLFVIIFSLIYICITLFSVYRLYHISIQSDEHIHLIGNRGARRLEKEKPIRLNPSPQDTIKKLEELKNVEVWGKAAIGLYLWKHILNGEFEDMHAGMIQHGSLQMKNINFIFRSGPGIIPTTVPSDVEHVVLILNGRSNEKIEAAKLWLDYLPFYLNLKRVAVVLLGNEECDNDWLLPYMKSNGGEIDIVFMVYDSPLVDEKEFYQWPLGVAVYRGFPNIIPEQVDLTSSRSYVCNFLGTVHNSSSRPFLMSKLANLQEKCIILGRKKWISYETEDSLNSYVKSILKSDLTLCPVGMNTECYRIYEAMSLGSVPVIEDNLTPGNCDAKSKTSPLRLLKAYGAPVIYIKDWDKLPQLIMDEGLLSLSEKVERRTAVIEWYKDFKRTLADKFINVIQQKFF